MEWLEAFVKISNDRLGGREREALWARGVSDDQIELYSLGHVGDRLPDLEYPLGFLDWSREGGRLRDTFVLPLTNTLGSVKGLQFRNVDPGKKGYSDYTPYTEEPVTFGLAQAIPHAWRAKSIWLVEGVFDVFPIQRVHPNTIPTLTNKLSKPMARLLRRLVTDLWLAYDMDEEGRKAVRKMSWEYRTEFKIHDPKFPRPVTLDGVRHAKDPNELWEAWGDDRFGKLLRGFT